MRYDSSNLAWRCDRCGYLLDERLLEAIGVDAATQIKLQNIIGRCPRCSAPRTPPAIDGSGTPRRSRAGSSARYNAVEENKTPHALPARRARCTRPGRDYV